MHAAADDGGQGLANGYSGLGSIQGLIQGANGAQGKMVRRHSVHFQTENTAHASTTEGVESAYTSIQNKSSHTP